ncbi:MAG: hypothetical protein JSR80_00900 [Verrucomicrobia bacterium]|nr:hypothetical protein [Verrucomicrobiota bacterium]
MKGYLRHANHLGIFLAILFILCFAWQWIHPASSQAGLHLFESFFFGYTGKNILSFILGLIESYIWGYIFFGLYCLSCRCAACCCHCKKP